MIRFTNLRQLYNSIKRNHVLSPRALAGITIGCIAIFGLVSTTMLIATNINSSFFKLVTFVTQYLPEYRDPNSKCIWCPVPTENVGDNKIMNKNNKVTLIGNAWIFGTFWMPKFVYYKDNDFKGFFTQGTVKTKKVLIVADRDLLDAISVKKPSKSIKQLQGFYKNATTIATFNENRPRYNSDVYPYQSMSENRGIGKIEIRANY